MICNQRQAHFRRIPLAGTNSDCGGLRIGKLTQPPYLVIRNVKTTSHFLKVTPLIWTSEGQNNESKSNKETQLLGGEGGVSRGWANYPSLEHFFFEGFPYEPYLFGYLTLDLPNSKENLNEQNSCPAYLHCV